MKSLLITFALVMILLMGAFSVIAQESDNGENYPGDERDEKERPDGEDYPYIWNYEKQIKYKMLECQKTINVLENQILSYKQQLLYIDYSIRDDDVYMGQEQQIRMEIGLLEIEIDAEMEKIEFLENHLKRYDIDDRKI